jgi:hypothetical protein
VTSSKSSFSSKSIRSRTLWQTKDYTVQNFPLEPRENGLPRREGGRFRPTRYAPDEDLSHALSPHEFREQYAASFETASVIEEVLVNTCGTGNRKVENSENNGPHVKEGKGKSEI